MMAPVRRLLKVALSAMQLNQTVDPLAIGLPAPDFQLCDQHGRLRSLSEWRGQWLVLYFYPKDDTPGCTAEACNFRDDWLQITALGAQVVGISVDTSASHKAFAEKHHLPFTLLADVSGDVARAYGALSDWKLFKFARRYTFVIDPQGRLAKSYLSVRASTHSAGVLADLRQLGAHQA
ncbi:MAG: hypothetical protein RLZZ596_868 [Pseudomonadota bacterium]|jgi:peroxiredoxin Q/BCP